MDDRALLLRTVLTAWTWAALSMTLTLVVEAVAAVRSARQAGALESSAVDGAGRRLAAHFAFADLPLSLYGSFLRGPAFGMAVLVAATLGSFLSSRLPDSRLTRGRGFWFADAGRTAIFMFKTLLLWGMLFLAHGLRFAMRS